MFIETETLPDPAKMRFLPGCPLLGQGILELRDRNEAAASPLAERLFAIQGVSGVGLGTDFIVVTKDSGDWQLLKPAILGTIMEHFTSGASVVMEPETRTTSEDCTAGLAARVKAALRRVIDPELGSDIVSLGLVYGVAAEVGGVVRVTMTTTTPGCPAASYLVEGAGNAARSAEGVKSADVMLVYEPRWTPEMMSDEARARFGIRDGGGW